MQAKQVTEKKNVVVAIDSGSFQSGIVILVDGKISFSNTSLNEEIVPLVKRYLGTKYKLRVLIEDIRPYFGMKPTVNVFDTCKFIGELEYRLRVARISYELISRSEIKAWAYSLYKCEIEALILDKMKKANKHLNKDGSLREASHVWIDDAIMVAAMRYEWNIPAERGKPNEYGVTSHGWQALAICTLFIKGYLPVILSNRKKREASKLRRKK